MGCLLAIVIGVGVVIGIASNWSEIKDWADETFDSRRSDVVGTIRAGSGGRIDVGDVRNAAGETTSYGVTFDRGVNVVELRHLDDNGASDTRLEIRINQGEFVREFRDDGDATRRSFEWVLEGVRR